MPIVGLTSGEMSLQTSFCPAPKYFCYCIGVNVAADVSTTSFWEVGVQIPHPLFLKERLGGTEFSGLNGRIRLEHA